METFKTDTISELHWIGSIENKIICEFEYFEDNRGRIWINNISTDEDYRKKGYGTKMLTEALKVYNKIYVSTANKTEIKSKGIENDCRHTNDELDEQHPLWIFIDKCIEKEIFKKDWVKHPFK